MTVDRDTLVRLARAAILTGLSDGLFASVLSVLVFHSTVTRVWQGVASARAGGSSSSDTFPSSASRSSLRSARFGRRRPRKLDLPSSDHEPPGKEPAYLRLDNRAVAQVRDRPQRPRPDNTCPAHSASHNDVRPRCLEAIEPVVDERIVRRYSAAKGIHCERGPRAAPDVVVPHDDAPREAPDVDPRARIAQHDACRR